jgi:class 3 adenylate cyclase
MGEERAQRRLAAILAADVAGYSQLMGGDEEGTLIQLKARRRRQSAGTKRKTSPATATRPTDGNGR